VQETFSLYSLTSVWHGGLSLIVYRGLKRPTLVQQKNLKLFGFLRGPGGALWCLPNPAAVQLASLRQCSPWLWIRLRFSATLNGAPQWANILKVRCLTLVW